jgi:hypothetical protein
MNGIEEIRIPVEGMFQVQISTIDQLPTDNTPSKKKCFNGAVISATGSGAFENFLWKIIKEACRLTDVKIDEECKAEYRFLYNTSKRVFTLVRRR